MPKEIKTIFEKSQKGQGAYSLPKSDPEFENFFPPSTLTRQSSLELPEISEIDLTRHFSILAGKNRGTDTHFYPLGSCSMKMNPRINEWCALLQQFTQTHPFAPENRVQGNLEIIFKLIQALCELTGMSAGSLLPHGGAQGEFVGMSLIDAYHKRRGDLKRTEVLIPDSAHGTNPISAAMVGYKTVTLKSGSQGEIDLNHLNEVVSEKTAALMLTNPNTLGLFSRNIQEIAELVHKNGALLYYDGANLNPLLNIVKPFDMGFDVMHVNLHKTFSTPHGGGGPGSGPVLCNDKLKDFLPVPRVLKISHQYEIMWNDPLSIGKVTSFFGNFSVYLKAYLFIKLNGHYGLRKIAEQAVLNANYLKKKLEPYLNVPFQGYCMHEFVVVMDRFLDQKISALDVAKRMLDYHIYAPSIYFPLIVKECMLIEPTESESKATLDEFIEIFMSILKEIRDNPEVVRSAPHTTSVGRLNEVHAARNLILKIASIK